MITCPCCGERFEGDMMTTGCAACGARAVGPPLARPERELPAYGHALAACLTGLLLALAFAFAVAAALFERAGFLLDVGALMRAGETAAWRLKWSALPAASVGTALCAWLYARMRREPSRFAGFGYARAGFAMTALTAVLMATLIGVTVPERLRRRELARRAGESSLLYAGDLALMRYRQRFGTYPATLSDLRRLDDPDCSLAKLLTVLEAGEYRPETDLASLSAVRSKDVRGRRRAGSAVRVRNASARNTEDAEGAGIVLTSYRITLPGRDGVLGTQDDLFMRDGLILDAPRAGEDGAGAHPRRTP